MHGSWLVVRRRLCHRDGPRGSSNTGDVSAVCITTHWNWVRNWRVDATKSITNEIISTQHLLTWTNTATEDGMIIVDFSVDTGKCESFADELRSTRLLTF
jgi:hypothetical protein